MLISMIHLCGKVIVEPLQILFLSFLEDGVYPDDWKKKNVVIKNFENKICKKKVKTSTCL